jgi:hypothetical protein
MHSRTFASAFTLLACAYSVAVALGQSTYDGNWWVSVVHDQRLGFVDGYVDCSALVNPRDQFYNAVPFEELVKRVDAFYSANAHETSQPVLSVLRRVANSSPVTTTPKSTFGLFDGEDWRQASEPYRLGFVQGYRFCYQSSGDMHLGRFGKSNQWYVDRISSWYGVTKGDPSEINPKRYKRMIAQVLFLFKDPVPDGTHRHEPANASGR